MKDIILQEIGTSESNIDALIPKDMNELQLRVIDGLKRKFREALNKLLSSEEFTWNEFDRLCAIFGITIDAREKKAGDDEKYGNIGGMPYKEIYEKHGITWFLDGLHNERKRVGEVVVFHELNELVSKAFQKSKRFSLARLQKEYPSLFLRLRSLLGIQEGEDNQKWTIIYNHIPKKFHSSFLIEEKSEENLEMKAYETIKRKNLEEFVVNLGDQPGKFFAYLQFVFPEATLDELKTITKVSFKGLRSGNNDVLGSIHKYSTELHSLEDCFSSEYIGHNTYRIKGTAPEDCHTIFVGGSWKKKVKVHPNKPFEFQVTVRSITDQNPEPENEVFFTSINDKDHKKSEPYWVNLPSMEKFEDFDYLRSLMALLSIRKDLKNLIKTESIEIITLIDHLKHSFVKRFSYNFKAGEKFMTNFIAEFDKNEEIKYLLLRILEDFREIETYSQKGLKKERKLMFFQKYSIHFIHKAMERGQAGVMMCNDPGTGKTPTGISISQGKKTLVACPNGVVSNWAEQYRKFFERPSVKLLVEMSIKQRVHTMAKATEQMLVTNLETLQRLGADKSEDELAEIFESIHWDLLILDEAHFRTNHLSQQSKGAKKIKTKFQLWLTATPYTNFTQYYHMFKQFLPEDVRFKSKKAFFEAFPLKDTKSAKELYYMALPYIVRFRKEDILDYFDLNIPLKDQEDHISHKEFVDPDEYGGYEMTEETTEALLALMHDRKTWDEIYRPIFEAKKESITRDDKKKLWKHNHLSESHAYQQVVNNLNYSTKVKNDTHSVNEMSEMSVEEILKNPKYAEAKRIVDMEYTQNGLKGIILCNYVEEAKIYEKLFAHLKPSMFTGETSRKGYLKAKDRKTWSPNYNPEDLNNTKLLKFKVDSSNNWIFDAKGYPIENTKGLPMTASDYERLTFHTTPLEERGLVIGLYSTMSEGSNFQRAGYQIRSSRARDIKQEIQSQDRNHRIDNEFPQYIKRYYDLIARNNSTVVERSKEEEIWYEKSGSMVRSTIFRKYFKQGSLDEVHYKSLKQQALLANLLIDGIEDSSYFEKMAENVKNFFLFENNDE